MPQGTHVHEWKYGEPKHIVGGGLYGQEIYSYDEVYRFCTQCLEGETVKLKKVNPSNK